VSDKTGEANNLEPTQARQGLDRGEKMNRIVPWLTNYTRHRDYEGPVVREHADAVIHARTSFMACFSVRVALMTSGALQRMVEERLHEQAHE